MADLDSAPAPRSPAGRARRPLTGLLLASVASIATGWSAAAAELPLTRVVLSTAGLAQFTHAGRITGGETIDLAVRLDQVDDVLKSLTVFDAVGNVGTVSLPGREPLDQLFRDLPFDRSALESPTALLDALVGSEVEITGPVAARGRVFRVEPETVQMPDGRSTTTRHRLSLLTDRGLVQAVFEEITSLSFTDARTRGQIDRAFAGLVENRAKDRRRLAIGLGGHGERSVAIGYVVAAPVWKTSWRLVLPKEVAAARLQGWAVVENLTGGDWTDVDLTLVSGNPVALTQPLYTPVFGERREVPVATTAAPAIAPPPPPAPVRKAARAFAAPGISGRGRPDALMAGAPAAAEVADAAPPMAPTTVAQAAEEATQILYHVPARLSLATGHTMMVPFVDREIAAERVWLYRPDVQPRRPFAAVRLKNDGASGLPAGIVTAFETSADGTSDHVGDALLPLLPRGADELVEFALDTRSEIRREDRGVRRTVLGTAVDGQLTTTVKSRRVLAYEVTAPPDEARDVLIEEPRPAGWTASADTGAVETTPTHLRRHIKAAAGETAKGELVLERIEHRSVLLTTLGPSELLAQIGGLDNEGPALKDAVERLGAVVAEIDRAQAEKERIDGERRRIGEDQERVRRNLSTTGANTDLGRRYLDTLRRQEDRLGELAKADQGLDQTIVERHRAAAEIARRLRL